MRPQPGLRDVFSGRFPFNPLQTPTVFPETLHPPKQEVTPPAQTLAAEGPAVDLGAEERRSWASGITRQDENNTG